MSNGVRHDRASITKLRQPGAMIAAAGLAAALTASALAVTSARLQLSMDTLGQFAGSLAEQGDQVVVGNIEGAHVWPTHEAFGGRVTRVWWSADDSPAFPGAGAARGLFFSAHATAVASAMAGRWNVIPNAPPGLFPNSVIGFAPGASLILSADFAAGVNADGIYLANTDNAIAFALLAMTDPTIASFAAAQLGINPPYPVATVVNASFGSVKNRSDRLAETIIAHAFDAAAYMTDAAVVVAAGDENQNPQLQEDMNADPMDPGGTIASPGTAYNVLTVGRLGQDLNSADQNSGMGPTGVVDWRSAGITVISSIDPNDFINCTAPFAQPEEMPSIRYPVQIVAPGTLLTLAGSPAFDPPSSVDPDIADTAFSDLWEGTSFASAIVAGAAAIVQDIGLKQGLWLNDDQGNPKPSGLVTRAVLINSVNDTGASAQTQTGTGSEADACVTNSPLDPALGAGRLDPKRLLNQLAFRPGSGNQVADVRAGSSYIVDGVPRTLEGFTRRGYAPTADDPTDIFRDPPPSFDPSDPFLQLGGTPPEQVDEVDGFTGWFNSWTGNSDTASTGTDPKIPFVTTIQEPTSGGLGGVMAPPDRPVRDPRAVTPLPGAAEAGPPEPKQSQYKPFGQPGLFPGPGGNLDNDRFDLGGPSTGTIPGPASGPGTGGGGSTNNFGQLFKTGWDLGKLGVGFIDYPLGIITPGSTVRATVVWNRTEIWSRDSLNTWASTATGFQVLRPFQSQLGGTQIMPLMATSDNDPNGAFPNLGPTLSPAGRELPPIQVAFGLDNIDLELWRKGNGQNFLIGASRSEWNTVEHISVGTDAFCQPTNNSDILFGQYFLRVIYKDTVYDLGGYRSTCGGVQSQQMLNIGGPSAPGNTYKNLYPGEVEFAVAWYVDLATSNSLPPGGVMGPDGPGDFNGDGVVDEKDISALVASTLGDLNDDGVIDATDLSRLLAKYGSDDARSDLNSDGVVDGADIAQLLARFGETPTP